MSNDANNGGPAFPGQWYDFQPYTGDQVVREQWEGMTLRDYFAAKALPAVYKDFWDDVRAGRHGSAPEDWTMGVALGAYALADAMLRARENESIRPEGMATNDTGELRC